MRWLRKKLRINKVEPIKESKFSFDANYEENKKLLETLKSERDAGVSRWDFIDAKIDSLILLHPEVKEQQPMVEFIARLKKYQEERPK